MGNCLQCITDLQLKWEKEKEQKEDLLLDGIMKTLETRIKNEEKRIEQYDQQLQKTDAGIAKELERKDLADRKRLEDLQVDKSLAETLRQELMRQKTKAKMLKNRIETTQIRVRECRDTRTIIDLAEGIPALQLKNVDKIILRSDELMEGMEDVANAIEDGSSNPQLDELLENAKSEVDRLLAAPPPPSVQRPVNKTTQSLSASSASGGHVKAKRATTRPQLAVQQH